MFIQNFRVWQQFMCKYVLKFKLLFSFKSNTNVNFLDKKKRTEHL